MPSDRTSLFALRMVFALNAIGLAVWFPRIPDVKDALGLDILTLALCLFALPAGTLAGFLVVGRMTERFGLKATCQWAGAGFLISFIGPALAPNAVLLGFALFVCGATVALIEVGMNAKAGQMERTTGCRLMIRCHAFWSFGTVSGALVGGAFAQGGVSFLAQQLILQPVFAAATVYFARRLMADDTAPSAAERSYALPSRALVLLCLIPTGALMVEGAMMEWSALLLRTHLAASPFATASALSAFALAMGLTRLFGDKLAEHVGPRRVMTYSGLLMGAGILSFGVSPVLWLSLPAAALAGIGCANIYPLAMSMAAQLPGSRPDRNVATLALIAFTAFLIGPPAIGLAASRFGLPVAFALLAPLGLAPLVLMARGRQRAAEPGA